MDLILDLQIFFSMIVIVAAVGFSLGIPFADDTNNDED